MGDDRQRSIPAGRLGRVARLAGLGLRTGAGIVLGRADQVAADRAAEVLGNLRGLAAKVGQMASYVDGVVPEDKRDAFEASLRVLRSRAPRSSLREIRGVIEEDLGAPIDALFAAFDDEPLASASIGQVHRARLPEELGGHDVAVKVQHPGIRKAVESDLSNAGLLEGLVALGGGRKFDSKGHLDILKARFREELDYALEGERMESFARVHEGDPTIHVPRFFRERSSSRVLTTELAHGVLLEDAAQRSVPERRAWAETLWRYVFKGNLIGGMFNADPHPGNYLFRDDGKITFLDYGCVQVLPEWQRPHARHLHRAAIRRDEDDFAEGVRRFVKSRPGRLESLAVTFSRKCFEPVFRSPFTITRPYAADLFETMKEMGLSARKLPEHEVFALPPEMLFLNRLQFGFYSVLARLDVEVDFAAVEQRFLPISD
jgi:predicted unusual protein kinase regulating ubiquinone biosynthesis (AarF/ABC1/UbiB family)